MTKFRFGLLIGGAVGYYLGARAGRDRYVQLSRLLQRARETSPVGTAVHKAKAVVDLGRERVHTHETNDLDDLVDLTTGDYRNN